MFKQIFKKKREREREGGLLVQAMKDIYFDDSILYTSFNLSLFV